MAVYQCQVCEQLYDEDKEGVKWEDLPDDWVCPVCASLKSMFQALKEKSEDSPVDDAGESSSPQDGSGRSVDDLEISMADIHEMARSGRSIIEPMRTKKPVVSWDDILIMGAQLNRIPLNDNIDVITRTVIGPKAEHPLEIETPVYVTHMSYGALSREAKVALSKGSAAAKTAMASGEGGILTDSLANAYKYIFEYVPNRYSATEENLKGVDAIEIKIGQSAKPGMGGHLPANKVTDEIAEVRGFPRGEDIISPAHFEDILTADDLKAKVAWLRGVSGGKPIGVKFAAGNVEADLEAALYSEPDFITIDGRPGATGAAPKTIKAATSVPTIFALYRARKYLREHNIEDVSLVITGGLRISSDFAKALALGADAIAVGTAALIAIGCQQYRICHTGKCPAGITTQDKDLRQRLNVDKGAEGLKNYFTVVTEELKVFARLTGHTDVHDLNLNDLCTTNSEISNHTDVRHV
ncbi:alpha-hydroxy-acid oxidizing protein [bacterium]|nr:alpha-hydroxy-acid oxidizing protein [bacterium]